MYSCTCSTQTCDWLRFFEGNIWGPIISLLTLTTLCVLWAVCCGVLTSSSPRCHPASEGFRRARPLPKPHSATSAIHKRQALSLSLSPFSSLAHTASDSHTPSFLSLLFSHPLTFYFYFFNFDPLFSYIPSALSSPFLHFWFYSARNRSSPYLSLPSTGSLSLFCSFFSLSQSKL